MKTVFMGTPDFAAAILETLYDSRNSVCLAITQPDRAKDRGKKVRSTPVKEFAQSHGIEVFQPEKIRNDEETKEKLRQISPDVIVVAAYGQILPEEILALPKYGCVNVHASLLPKLRGASPIQQAIVRGEEKTGITIMQMDSGLDTGDILAQEEIQIGDLNSQQLHDRLASIGGSLLLKTLDMLEKENLTPLPQNKDEATYAGLISKKDGKIDFKKSPEEIERLIRGFDPWPGAFCSMGGATVKFWKAEASDEETDVEDGTVIGADENGIKICCGGRILIVKEIQAPGKKRMKAADYLRGHDMKIGSKFE